MRKGSVRWSLGVLVCVMAIVLDPGVLACVTCEDFQCKATQGNGAERCRSNRRLGSCHLRGHCQVQGSVGGEGASSVERASAPSSRPDLRPPRFERTVNGVFGTSIRKEQTVMARGIVLARAQV